jgi:endonuclease YncB( thermonuclease family)
MRSRLKSCKSGLNCSNEAQQRDSEFLTQQTFQIKQFLKIALLCCWVAHALTAQAKQFSGTVISVSDGDTLKVLTNDAEVKVRLLGIDAPESDQPFGRASQTYLAEAVAGRSVVVVFQNKDRYGRIIGKVLLDDTDVNLRQVKAGYAWWYEYYKRNQAEADRQAYFSAEQQARNNGLGLWAVPRPINPYDWRKGNHRPPPHVENKTFNCGEKLYCKEMASCTEATFYFEACALTGLDGDGDGTPCESLCP